MSVSPSAVKAASPIPLDPELQAALARHGLAALDRLLTGQAAGESIACGEVGALVRLIDQARRAGEAGAAA